MESSQAYDERYAWLDARLKKLILSKPWLISKLKEPNGISWLVIEYWREYEGVKVIVADFDKNPTNPETIARRARELGLSRTKVIQSTLEPFKRSG